MDKKLFSTQIGLPLVTYIVMGMMVGAGVFVYTGLVYQMTGSFLPWAYLLAGIPVFLSMLPLAMLGSAFPVSGANYYYPSRMVSPQLAFAAVWVYALASFFGQIPLYLKATAGYLESIIPGLPHLPVALGLLTLFYTINLFGIRLAAQLQGILLLSMVLALVVYISGSLPNMNTDLLHQSEHAGSGSLLLGTALLSFTYFGANGIIELGSEIRRPHQTIPRSFYIAFPIVMILYTGVAYSLVSTTTPETIQGSSDPLLASARQNLPPELALFFVTGGAILALLTTLNALFIIGTRSLMVIVQDRLLPAWMGRMSPKKEVPWILLTLIFCLSVLGLLSGLSLEDFASYASLGGLCIFLPVLLAALVFPSRFPGLYSRAGFRLKKWFLFTAGILGIAMVLFFGLVILVDMGSIGKSAFFVFFIASGWGYFALRRRHLIKKYGNFTIDMMRDEN